MEIGGSMCEHSSRIIIKPQEVRASVLEMDAAVSQGRVCVSFRCNGTVGHHDLANQLRAILHDKQDQSIVEKDGVHTMSTKFPSIQAMMEFLRSQGYRCEEYSGGLAPMSHKIRIDPPTSAH